MTWCFEIFGNNNRPIGEPRGGFATEQEAADASAARVSEIKKAAASFAPGAGVTELLLVQVKPEKVAKTAF